MSNLNIISTENASKPNGHYSQAIEANGFIFTSVQLGLAPNEIATVSQQLRNALYNTEQILIAAGSGLDLVVKLTIYLSDISEWATVNVVVAEIFGNHKPARGVVPVNDLHLGSKVAVDVVAVKRHE